VAGMEVAYGPSSMGPILTKADLAINAAKGSTGQQTETNAVSTSLIETNYLLGGKLMTLDLFYSGRGSCSSGLELTHIPNHKPSVSIGIWGLASV